MADSTNANPDLAGFGRAQDSSNLYYNPDGSIAVQTKFVQPQVDIQASISAFLAAAQKKNGFKSSNDILSFFFEGDNLVDYNLSYIDHTGSLKTQSNTVEFKMLDSDGDQKTRREPTDWWYKNVPICERSLSDCKMAIADDASQLLLQLIDDKIKAEEELTLKLQSANASTDANVSKICDLLGLSKADAIAYLAAGGSVEEATKKVQEWNLASPSERKKLIAQDAIDENGERRNFGEEFTKGEIGNAIEYKAKKVEDMFDGIRFPFEERKATKAYIALVKENKTNEVGTANTLIKLEQFWMQSVSEVDSEKYQIVETFNKPKIYFFDRRARVYQYSFVVENTGKPAFIRAGSKGDMSQVKTSTEERYGNQWRDIFKSVYENYLRGTKAIEERVKAVIHYDGLTRIGYVLSCAMSMDSQNDNLAQVQLSVFIEDEKQETNVFATNNFIDSSDLKRAEATALDIKRKDGTVAFKNNVSSNLEQRLVINTKISNFANNENIASTLDGFYVYIIETEKGKEPNLTNPEYTYGEVQVKSIVCELKGIDISKALIIVNKDKPSNVGLTTGGSIGVNKDGQKCWVVLNKSAFTTEMSNSLNNKTAEQVQYVITLSYQEQDFTIIGFLLLKKEARSIVVKTPGAAGAKVYMRDGKYSIEFNCSTLDTVEIQQGRQISTFKDTEIQIIEGKTPLKLSQKDFFSIQPNFEKEAVGVPDGTDVSTYPVVTFNQPELSGTDAFKLPFILAERTDSNDKVLFPGESVKYTQDLNILGVEARIVVNYKRGKDSVDWKVAASSVYQISDASGLIRNGDITSANTPNAKSIFSYTVILAYDTEQYDDTVINNFMISGKNGNRLLKQGDRIEVPMKVTMDFEDNNSNISEIDLDGIALLTVNKIGNNKGVNTAELKKLWPSIQSLPEGKFYQQIAIDFVFNPQEPFQNIANTEGLKRATQYYNDNTFGGKETSWYASIQLHNNIDVDYNVNLKWVQLTFDVNILKTTYKESLRVKLVDPARTELDYAWDKKMGFYKSP